MEVVDGRAMLAALASSVLPLVASLHDIVCDAQSAIEEGTPAASAFDTRAAARTVTALLNALDVAGVCYLLGFRRTAGETCSRVT
jgi:hypothetical protein